jgi:hypothetical protein
MSLPDLTKLTVGLSPTWAGFLRDLGSVAAGGQLSRDHPLQPPLGGRAARPVSDRVTAQDPDADDADDADPCAVTRAYVEAFQARMGQQQVLTDSDVSFKVSVDRPPPDVPDHWPGATTEHRISQAESRPAVPGSDGKT